MKNFTNSELVEIALKIRDDKELSSEIEKIVNTSFNLADNLSKEDELSIRYTKGSRKLYNY
jgi:hypothetical protein